MRRRQFSRPPMVGTDAKAPTRAARGELATEIQQFKNTYVHERRILERFRQGDAATTYKPAASLDGKSRFNSPEEPTTTNQWDQMYHQLERLQPHVRPTHYVRVMFKILRGSALAIPTLKQLATVPMQEMVAEYLKANELELREQFVTESQRAKSSITINQKGVGHSLALSVYYAIVDTRLELSPLFKYCLATTTCAYIRQGKIEDSHCEKLDRLAKRFEFLAALDYTVFPDLYDQVWGNAIPAGFRVAAFSILAAALEQ